MNIIDKLINWFNGGEKYNPPKPSEPKKPDISQPIIEFVELMKRDMKRFDITSIPSYYHKSRITDRKTGLSIEFTTIYSYMGNMVSSNTDWVTSDEAKLIYKTIQEITDKRVTRIAKVREWQNKRKRNKWVNVYCSNLEDE